MVAGASLKSRIEDAFRARQMRFNALQRRISRNGA
jgi:hypothetical protein